MIAGGPPEAREDDMDAIIADRLIAACFDQEDDLDEIDEIDNDQRIANGFNAFFMLILAGFVVFSLLFAWLLTR